jgi:hypothetical protein
MADTKDPKPLKPEKTTDQAEGEEQTVDEALRQKEQEDREARRRPGR